MNNNLFSNTGFISHFPLLPFLPVLELGGCKTLKVTKMTSPYMQRTRTHLHPCGKNVKAWKRQMVICLMKSTEAGLSRHEGESQLTIWKKSCAIHLTAEQVEFEFLFFRETIVQTFNSWGHIGSGFDMTCKLTGDYRVMPWNHPRDPFGLVPEEDLQSGANMLYSTPPCDKNTDAHCPSPRRQGQNRLIPWDSFAQS